MPEFVRVMCYSQGIAAEEVVRADKADEVISRLQSQGYVCWKVRTSSPSHRLVH